MLHELTVHLPFLQGLSLLTVLNWAGFFFALAFIPSILLQRSDRPMSALAWILCLIELPFVGILFWWIFGLRHLRRRRRKRRKAMSEIDIRLRQQREQLDSLVLPAEESERLTLGPIQADTSTQTSDEFALQVVNFFDIDAGIFPSSSNNHIKAYTNGVDAFKAFEDAIKEAKDHVHFEFYIWEDDETGHRFRDLLIECAQRGVEVRALYDAIGGSRVNGKFMKKLKKAGGQAAPFLPVTLLERRLRINFRNHRKIIVIDGKIAFTGGINIADEYTNWHDTAFRFEGPVVYQFQEVFAEDWYFATNQDIVDSRYFPPVSSDTLPQHRDTTEQGAHTRVLASGPDMRAQAIHKAFFIAMTQATSRVWFLTPYFIPDEAILMAIETAAMRGVDVRIILPGKGATDVFVTYWAGRSFYERLLDAGVHIYEFKGRILHAKNLILDDKWSFVGSSNMDIRSFRLNFETNCIIEDEKLNERLSQFFEDSLEECEKVSLEPFINRPNSERLLESTVRLFSPLM